MKKLLFALIALSTLFFIQPAFAFGDAEKKPDQPATICIYVDVSGRVADVLDNGISTTIDIDSLLAIDPIEKRIVRSNQFGYYTAPNLISCENYDFTPTSNRYTFAPQTITVIPAETTTGVDFIGTDTQSRFRPFDFYRKTDKIYSNAIPTLRQRDAARN